MAKKTVEEELVAATGIKPKAKEKRPAYLGRLHAAASELDDEGWKGLSSAAQKWVNVATKEFDADKPIPDFGEETPAPKAGKAKADEEEDDDAEDGAADEPETNADEPEGEGEEEDTTTVSTKKPAKKATAAKAAKPAAKPTKDKAEAKPAKKAKSNGGVQAVMNYVLKNPDDSVADVVAQLKKDGITVTTSTVSSARGFFKLVVRFLQDKKLTTKKIFD